MSGRSTCGCGELATRMIRVAPLSGKGKLDVDDARARSVAAAVARDGRSGGRPIMSATCEAHRHSVSGQLKAAWRDEIKARHVRVLLGKRRAAGL